ncbi:MAG: FAD binding domain-containing protein [Treponema sp.]|nr:FAD binding domain-containing protein [Treponema sp.]
MEDRPDTVFRPESYAELFSQWEKSPDAEILAGGTEIMRRLGGRRAAPLPRSLIVLDGIEEMRRISRSESYLEIGAAATLSRIIELGKHAPGALLRCLRGIACPQLRGMASLGGNVFSGLDASAALVALDAQYELRRAQSARWIAAARFAPAPGELICRIRVPLDAWDFSEFRKFPGRSDSGGIAVFLAKAQKNTLTDVRVICKDALETMRDKDAQDMLIGKRLPLARKTASAFAAHWKERLRSAEGADDVLTGEFAAFIEATAQSLAE